MNDRFRFVLGALLILILLSLVANIPFGPGGGTGAGSGGSGGSGGESGGSDGSGGGSGGSDGSGGTDDGGTGSNLELNVSVNMENVSLDIIHYTCYEYNLSYYVSANQGVPVSLTINGDEVLSETIVYANRTHEYCLFDETIFTLTIHNQTYTSNVSVYVFPYESWNANLSNVELRNGRYYVNMTAYYYIDNGIKLHVSFDADPITLSKITNVRLNYQLTDYTQESYNYQNESFTRDDQRSDVEFITFIITTIDGTIIAYSFLPKTGSLFDGYVYTQVVNNETLEVNSVIFRGSEYITDITLEYMVVGYDNTYRFYGSVPLSFNLPISTFSYVDQTGYFSIVLKLTYYSNNDVLGVRYTAFNSIIISNNPQLSHNVNVQKVFEYKDESFCYAHIEYLVNVSSTSHNVYAIDYYVNGVKLGTTYTETDQETIVILDIFDDHLYNGENNISLKIRHGSNVIYEHNDTIEIECIGSYSFLSLGESQDPVTVCEDVTSSFQIFKWTQNGQLLRLDYRVEKDGQIVHTDQQYVDFSQRGTGSQRIDFIIPSSILSFGRYDQSVDIVVDSSNTLIGRLFESLAVLIDCNQQSYNYLASIQANAIQIEDSQPYRIDISVSTNKPFTYIETIEVYFVEDIMQYSPGAPHYHFMDIFDYTGQNRNQVTLSYDSYLASYVYWTRSQGGFHQLEVRVTFSDGTVITNRSNEFSNAPLNNFLFTIDNTNLNPNNQQTITLHNSALLNNLKNVTFYIYEDTDGVLPYSPKKNLVQSFSFNPFQINSTTYTFPSITFWDYLTWTKINGIPVRHRIAVNVTYQTINGEESVELISPPFQYQYLEPGYSITISFDYLGFCSIPYYSVYVSTSEPNVYIDYIEFYGYTVFNYESRTLIGNYSYYNQNKNSVSFGGIHDPNINYIFILVKYSNGIQAFNRSDFFFYYC